VFPTLAALVAEMTFAITASRNLSQWRFKPIAAAVLLLKPGLNDFSWRASKKMQRYDEASNNQRDI